MPAQPVSCSFLSLLSFWLHISCYTGPSRCFVIYFAYFFSQGIFLEYGNPEYLHCLSPCYLDFKLSLDSFLITVFKICAYILSFLFFYFHICILNLYHYFFLLLPPTPPFFPPHALPSLWPDFL